MEWRERVRKRERKRKKKRERERERERGIESNKQTEFLPNKPSSFHYIAPTCFVLYEPFEATSAQSLLRVR